MTAEVAPSRFALMGSDRRMSPITRSGPILPINSRSCLTYPRMTSDGNTGAPREVFSKNRSPGIVEARRWRTACLLDNRRIATAHKNGRRTGWYRGNRQARGDERSAPWSRLRREREYVFERCSTYGGPGIAANPSRDFIVHPGVDDTVGNLAEGNCGAMAGRVRTNERPAALFNSVRFKSALRSRLDCLTFRLLTSHEGIKPPPINDIEMTGSGIDTTNSPDHVLCHGAASRIVA